MGTLGVKLPTLEGTSKNVGAPRRSRPAGGVPKVRAKPCARLPTESRLRDTQRTMPEESKTPDLVELVRGQIDAINRGGFDAMMSITAPDAVFDVTHRGLGSFRGREMIRKVGEAWLRTFEDFEMELQEVVALGGGVVFTVQRTKGRPPGTTAYVDGWEAYVIEFEDGMIVRNTNYGDPDEARAAAERLALERADG